MKKLLVIALLLLPTICFAETWYTMSEKDYNDFAARRSQCWFPDNRVEWTVLRDVMNKLEKIDTDSDALRRLKFQQAADKAAKETDRKLGLTDRLSVDDKVSILGGRITLLENEILILKDQLKGFRGIK